MNRDIRLLFALVGHACANLVDKPALELFCRLQRSSADNQSIRIESVDHDIEKNAERMRLNAEDFLAHRIAALCQTTYEFCAPSKIPDLRELVAWISSEEKWKQASLNRRERAQRFKVSTAPTVA